MVSTKFERTKFGEAIELLQKTAAGVWTNINISQENMNACP